VHAVQRCKASAAKFPVVHFWMYGFGLKKENTENLMSDRLSPAGKEPDYAGNEDTRKGVQSVENAFSLLQVFTRANGALAIKTIAELSGMPGSKVHHYLVSLVRMGVTDGRYDLAAVALQMGLTALKRLEPVELAMAAARHLRDETGEATFVSVWGSYGPTIIRYFEGTQPVTVEVKAGNVLPLTSSATGRVYLAWGIEALIEPILTHERIDQSTTQNIRRETLSTGFGRVDGELLPRIASLAAPVFDQDGRLTLVMTQLGWSGDFNNNVDGDVADALMRTTEQLSRDLGYTRTSESVAVTTELTSEQQ